MADARPVRLRRMTLKWGFVALFWILQALLILTVLAVWIAVSDANGARDFFAHFGEVWLYPLANGGGDVAMLWTTIGVLTVLQAVYLWPVRRPSSKGGGGTSVVLALVVAGLCAAFLVLAVVMSLLEVLGGPQELLDREPLIVLGTGAFGTPRGISVWWVLLATLGAGWLVATPLLMAFCGRGSREKRLARVSAWLFVGTVIETAAIIPLDVMVRRRDPCYCATGTFWGLIITGGIGVFVLGPAVLIPILSRRRKRWYAGRCEVCGYDMRGLEQADRCPECGTGWRARD